MARPTTMLRTIQAFFAAFCCTILLPAQSEAEREFAAVFQRAYEYKDSKGLDRLLTKKPQFPNAAIMIFQSLRVEIWGGKQDLEPKAAMLAESWKRVFEGSEALDEVARWVSGQDERSYASFSKYRDNQWKAWSFYLEESARTPPVREQIEKAREALTQVARQFQSTGHKLDEAEAWGLVATCSSRMPERTLEDREITIDALGSFVRLREAWHHTKDQFFLQNKNFLDAEKEAIELDRKEKADREAKGYSGDVKGIDAYVMPGVAQQESELEFAALKDYSAELPYCQLGGPLPQYWNYVGFGKDVAELKLNWFRRQDLHLLREGSTKFAVSTVPSDPSRTQAVKVSGKGEATTFFLDSDSKVPYAMFFWMGTDSERIGEASTNLAPSEQNTAVYFSSAASWSGTIGEEAVTFYDDNGSGLPMDPDPTQPTFPMYSLGEEKSEAPLLDSMRVGKADRMPFSEFVKVGDAWYYVTRTPSNKLGVRPLNPDYFKTGKVKLEWKGGKSTEPAQLVIRGSGDFQSAVFDIAGKKEVEVPAGEYSILMGQITSGKGARMQSAMIVPGPKTGTLVVEAGKTATLKMGAPFKIDFERAGSDKQARIDATRIVVRDTSGCAMGRMHNASVVPDVMVARDESGKGAKKVAKFSKFTDSELLVKATQKYPSLGLQAACFPIPADSRDGDMTLVVDVPEGMKVGLQMKKHPMFGKLSSDWK